MLLPNPELKAPGHCHLQGFADTGLLSVREESGRSHDPTRSERKERGPMKFKFNAVAAAMLAATLVVSFVHAQDAPPPHRHKKAAEPPSPSVQDQIEALRQQMQSQIDTLKSDLSSKDAQLQQAQQAAADAQAAAAKAQAAVDAQQQSFTENTTAVSTLQSTVTDLKANQVSLATTV